jgi:hypothetical protein
MSDYYKKEHLASFESIAEGQPELGPPPGQASLRSRRLPLADPRQQIERLAALELQGGPHGGSFDAALDASGWPALTPARLEIFQINLGKLAAVIHPYPTQAEAIRKAGDLYNRTRLTEGRAKLLRRYFAWRR